jgi:stage II sporulation protein AB (anti-sigma F factor)
MITMHCIIEGNEIMVEIKDSGVGIENVEKAMEPLYTSRPELERSGMGFSFMEAFMDDLEVTSQTGSGTLVRMRKKVGKAERIKEYTQEAGQKVH